MDLDYIKAPDAPPEYVAEVSPSFHYNSFKRQFPTIQEAIDFMHGKYGAHTGVIINVHSGYYTEQIHSYPGYFIRGIARHAPTNELRPVTLYNTGADPAHYPMRAEANDFYLMQNMNIMTDAGGTFGKLGQDRYDGVYFGGGSFTESTFDTVVYNTWMDCSFVNSKAFNLTGTNVANARYLVLLNCWFGWWQNPVLTSTHTGGYAVFDMDGGHLAFTNLTLGGDWYHFAKNYHSFGAYRHVYDTTAGIAYRGVTVSNGIHFVSNPGVFQMANCDMLDSAEMPLPADQCDITADVPITDAILVGNQMFNGICGEIQITDHVKNVGGDASNKYFDLVEAVKSVTGEDIIMLGEDQIDVPKLTMPASGTVQIRGRSLYGITFTGDIADLTANDILIFDACGAITGGTVNVNGNNAELHMHGCICSENAFEILVTSGTDAIVHIRDSSLTGSAGKSALQINSIDPSYKVSFSRLTGATGEPAVEFTVEADDKFKAKFSTLLHGDGGANYPVIYTGAGKISIAVYNSGLNSPWNAAEFANSIGGANNATDIAIDF